MYFNVNYYIIFTFPLNFLSIIVQLEIQYFNALLAKLIFHWMEQFSL